MLTLRPFLPPPCSGSNTFVCSSTESDRRQTWPQRKTVFCLSAGLELRVRGQRPSKDTWQRLVPNVRCYQKYLMISSINQRNIQVLLALLTTSGSDTNHCNPLRTYTLPHSPTPTQAHTIMRDRRFWQIFSAKSILYMKVLVVLKKYCMFRPTNFS